MYYVYHIVSAWSHYIELLVSENVALAANIQGMAGLEAEISRNKSSR